MKKIIIMAVCLCLLLTVFAGCNKNGVDDENATTASTTEAGKVDDSDYELSKILGTDYSQYIELGEYKDIVIDINSEKYQNLRKQYIESTLSENGAITGYEDRAVLDGDTVNIDFVGYVDGKKFDGGEDTSYPLTIGSKKFIDDFEEQLIGHKPGETVNVNVTFPEVYESNTDLAGKDALFKVTINYISSAPIYPDISKDADVLKQCFNCDTMEEFEKQTQDMLASNLAVQIAMDNAKVNSYPQDRLDVIEKQYESLYEMTASYYGVSVEEYISAMGIDIEEVSKNQLKAEMFFLEILRKNGSSYTDEEYDEICTDYAEEAGYESLDALMESVEGSYDSVAQAKYDLVIYLLQSEAQKIIVDSMEVI